jgi:hypothetical protein
MDEDAKDETSIKAGKNRYHRPHRLTHLLAVSLSHPNATSSCAGRGNTCKNGIQGETEEVVEALVVEDEER